MENTHKRERNTNCKEIIKYLIGELLNDVQLELATQRGTPNNQYDIDNMFKSLTNEYWKLMYDSETHGIQSTYRISSKSDIDDHALNTMGHWLCKTINTKNQCVYLSSALASIRTEKSCNGNNRDSQLISPSQQYKFVYTIDRLHRAVFKACGILRGQKNDIQRCPIVTVNNRLLNVKRLAEKIMLIPINTWNEHWVLAEINLSIDDETPTTVNIYDGMNSDSCRAAQPPLLDWEKLQKFNRGNMDTNTIGSLCAVKKFVIAMIESVVLYYHGNTDSNENKLQIKNQTTVINPFNRSFIFKYKDCVPQSGRDCGINVMVMMCHIMNASNRSTNTEFVHNQPRTWGFNELVVDCNDTNKNHNTNTATSSNHASNDDNLNSPSKQSPILKAEQLGLLWRNKYSEMATEYLSQKKGGKKQNQIP